VGDRRRDEAAVEQEDPDEDDGRTDEDLDTELSALEADLEGE